MIKSLFSSLVLASNLNIVDRLAKGEIEDAAKLTILIILKIIGKHFNVQQLTLVKYILLLRPYQNWNFLRKIIFIKYELDSGKASVKVFKENC